MRVLSRTALLLAAGAVLATGLAGFAPGHTGWVTGTVSEDGRGLGGIVVTLEGYRVNEWTATDSSGRFGFAGVPFGTYSVALPSLPEGMWVRNSRRLIALEPESSDTVDFQAQPIPEVVITVIPDSARVRVSPDPLYIVPGQPVLWRLDPSVDVRPGITGAFSIQFEALSPLLHRSMRAAAGDSILGQVRDNILPGKYRYFVAVLHGGLIYTEDPELIDDNGDLVRPGPGN